MAYIKNNELISIVSGLIISINIDNNPSPVIIYSNNVLMSDNKLYKIIDDKLFYVDLGITIGEPYQVEKIFDRRHSDNIIVKTNAAYYIVPYDVIGDLCKTFIIDSIDNNVSINKILCRQRGKVIFYVDNYNFLYFVTKCGTNRLIDTDVTDIIYGSVSIILYQKKNLQIIIKRLYLLDGLISIDTSRHTTNITFPIDNICHGDYVINNGKLYSITFDTVEQCLSVNINDIGCESIYYVDFRYIKFDMYVIDDSGNIMKVGLHYDKKIRINAKLLDTDASFKINKNKTKSANKLSTRAHLRQ
jgi:hypothetical protein